MTSSPCPISSASSTSTIASVPFAQLTVSCTPSRAAASRSNDSTSGPKMNRPDSSVCANASCSFGISGAYCALTSTWGIDIAGAHRSRAAPTQYPVRHTRHDSHHDRDLDPAEVVVERLPVRPECPAGGRQNDAPDRVADQRQQVVAREGALENTGGDRHERTRDRGHAPHQHRPCVPALEPALCPVELLRRQVEPAAVALEEGPAAAEADPPAEDRPELVADHARQHDGDERRQPRPVPAEDVDAVRQRARGEGAGVDHHELARRGEDRVDEHQDEDGENAVVGEPRGHGPGAYSPTSEDERN